MFSILITIHSILRWLLLFSMLYAISLSCKGWIFKTSFTKLNNLTRLSTVVFAHLQLIIGLWLYFSSPVIKFFLNNFEKSMKIRDVRFFAIEHSFMMIISVIIITIGSSVSKRKVSDIDKFKTLTIWFSIALLIIFFAIPWPFLPFAANRPYLR